MKNKHIIDLLESTPFGSLNETELTTIRVHAAECSPCLRAFEAAQVAALMLKERTTETFEPSPFFHTRVLAQLRERQAANDKWAWSRIWRATGALTSSMVATVAALAVLTFVIPDSQVGYELETTSARNSYSAEEVILNPGDLLDELASDSSVLTTLDDAAEDGAK
jgi:hypothetical protein